MSLKPSELYENLRTTFNAMVYQGTTEAIFQNGVYAVPEFPVMQLQQIYNYSAHIVDRGGVPHKEHPGLIITKFDILIFLEHLGDEFGQYIVLGGNSKRSIKEIEESIIWSFENITELASNRIVLRNKVIGKKKFIRNNTPITTCLISCEAFTSIY